LYKSEGHELPRPGTKVSLEFASVQEIDQYETEAVDFFRRILAMDYYEIFISDQSSLYDFCWTDDGIHEKLKLIEDTYNISIGNIEGYKIVHILKGIKEGIGSS
jgi:hypothetical protein